MKKWNLKYVHVTRSGQEIADMNSELIGAEKLEAAHNAVVEHLTALETEVLSLLEANAVFENGDNYPPEAYGEAENQFKAAIAKLRTLTTKTNA